MARYGTWTLLILFLAAAKVNTDGAGPYRELGTTVIISADPGTDLVTSITWKHGPDIAAEWFGDEVKCYRHFKGRCQLDLATGNLTIRELTLMDNGTYTAEINNGPKGTAEIQVIAPVPTPTVTTRCNTEMTHCVLTCEGNITDAGLVEYSWISDDMEISGNKVFNITKETLETKFHCSLKNPVSRKSSKVVENPFHTVTVKGNRIYALFLIPVVLILILLFVLYKWRQRRRCKGNKRDGVHLEKRDGVRVLHHDVHTGNTEENTLMLPTSTGIDETSGHPPNTRTAVPTSTVTSDTRTEADPDVEEQTETDQH